MILSLPSKALRTLVGIGMLIEVKRIQGGCLFISSLLGKALRMFVGIVRFFEM